MADNKRELYPQPQADRRLLPNVPGRGQSRRGDNTRYHGDISVRMELENGKSVTCGSVDLSRSGMLVEFPEGAEAPAPDSLCSLRFLLPPGVMPEGYESRIHIKSKVVRILEAGGGRRVALEFTHNLQNYLRVRYWLRNLLIAAILLGISVLTATYMRQVSVFYFTFNTPVFLYSLMATFFLLTRYLFASMYRNVPVDADYTPGVSIIIPCFNEETWIHRTISDCQNQDYPLDKLEVIVVDDGSRDGSLDEACKTVRRLRQETELADCKVFRQPVNLGKRHALAAGALRAKFDLLVFVDSDSFLEPNAIREIVQPFKDPKMGAVGGRTEVYNKWTNFLTKIQAVRYYVAFRFFKASEGIFDAVTCLSGPLACYRKDLVLKYLEPWCAQRFMGRPATFGDDRSMTNFILSGHRASYQDSAVCSTIVPSDMGVFLRQQMRWKRSWLRESLRSSLFIWRKEPFMALSFYMGLFMPILAPLVVIRAFVIMPVVYGLYPTTYCLGLLIMGTLMSASYLLFKRSSLWYYGFVFCVFYLAVLMWQMPWAIVTFASSKWGTRETSLEKNVEGGRTLPSPQAVETEKIDVNAWAGAA